MTEELKKHLSKLLSHSYQMGKSDGYTQGFKDAIETLKGSLEYAQSADTITKKIMDDNLKKLWSELENVLKYNIDPDLEIKTVDPLDNTFLNGLIKSEVP